MLISRSRTVEPLFPDLVIDSSSVVEMVFEWRFRVSFSIPSWCLRSKSEQLLPLPRWRLAFWGRQWVFFWDVAIIAKWFWAFILPVVENCSPVWISAATSHLSLLDRVVSQVSRLSDGSVSCVLWHRRKVASQSVFFKFDSLVDHPVRGLFPAQYVLRRPTRGALAARSRSFEMPRSRTVQFSRSFVLSCVRLWNGLHETVFAGVGIGVF